jgi:hypothetical protein
VCTSGHGEETLFGQLRTDVKVSAQLRPDEHRWAQCNVGRLGYNAASTDRDDGEMCLSETSVSRYTRTRCYNPENRHFHRGDNLKAWNCICKQKASKTFQGTDKLNAYGYCRHTQEKETEVKVRLRKKTDKKGKQVEVPTAVHPGAAHVTGGRNLTTHERKQVTVCKEFARRN